MQGLRSQSRRDTAGALGGRLDHTLSNLNALYAHPELPLVLIGDGNIVRLLRKGTTRITPDKCEGKYCGVVPLQGAAQVTSRGLQWDMGALLAEWQMLFPQRQCNEAA